MNTEIKIASCGLACVLCSEKRKGECQGCTEDKAENCDIKKCSQKQNIQGCYECNSYPCHRDMFKNNRVNAFVESAKELGVDGLAIRLEENHEQGILYHPEDGSKGHYDRLSSKEEIKKLIMGQ